MMKQFEPWFWALLIGVVVMTVIAVKVTYGI